MKHIFIVDDEKGIRDIVRKYLEKENYQVTTFFDGSTVLEEIIRLKPDLIVLDIMMPHTDGLEICKQIRKKYDIPIIFISAKGEEIDRIIGLEIGADDYLVKPFSPRELVVRIKNILRRSDKTLDNQPSIIQYKDIYIDEASRSIKVNQIDLKLTLKEYEVLGLLVSHNNIPFSRDQILEKIWGYDFVGETRVVDDIIKRLRKKLTDSGSQVEIITVWGYGYKIGD